MSQPEPTGDSYDATAVAQVGAAVRSIAPGRVISYGALGARCEPPLSGYICGRILRTAAQAVPWWRVVARDGALPINKRNPLLAVRQRELLEAEGVEFDEQERVLMARFAAG